MDRRTWMYIAIIAVTLCICTVALLLAGVTELAIAGGQVKIPLSGAWVSTAANGVDAFRCNYVSGAVYIYSLAYNTSVVLATPGQSGYLIYPVWSKRVTFTWTRTSNLYAHVKVSVV